MSFFIPSPRTNEIGFTTFVPKHSPEFPAISSTRIVALSTNIGGSHIALIWKRGHHSLVLVILVVSPPDKHHLLVTDFFVLVFVFLAVAPADDAEGDAARPPAPLPTQLDREAVRPLQHRRPPPPRPVLDAHRRRLLHVDLVVVIPVRVGGRGGDGGGRVSRGASVVTLQTLSIYSANSNNFPNRSEPVP